MDWESQLGIETSDRIEQIRSQLDQKKEEKPNIRFDKKFRPGTVERVNSSINVSSFDANRVETPRDPRAIGKTLEALKATGYIQEGNGNSNKKRYSLDEEHFEDAFYFSKIKLAEYVEEVIQQFDEGNITEDLSEYDVLDRAIEVNGSPKIDASVNVSYTGDTVDFLKELSLIDDDNRALGHPADFETVYRVVEYRGDNSN